MVDPVGGCWIAPLLRALLSLRVFYKRALSKSLYIVFYCYGYIAQSIWWWMYLCYGLKVMEHLAMAQRCSIKFTPVKTRITA